MHVRSARTLPSTKYFPVVHVDQAMHCFDWWLSLVWYDPEAQLAHVRSAWTLPTTKYLPAAHVDQAVHDLALRVVLYCPALHALQLLPDRCCPCGVARQVVVRRKGCHSTRQPGHGGESSLRTESGKRESCVDSTRGRAAAAPHSATCACNTTHMRAHACTLGAHAHMRAVISDVYASTDSPPHRPPLESLWSDLGCHI